ncbi:MAG: helix-turn-helix transcriptional regulator [Oscillospiraceae bacterium]|nr:helix-turn-helix transcriptional regulator [Oscillospiraceae bacterium]
MITGRCIKPNLHCCIDFFINLFHLSLIQVVIRVTVFLVLLSDQCIQLGIPSCFIEFYPLLRFHFLIAVTQLNRHQILQVIVLCISHTFSSILSFIPNRDIINIPIWYPLCQEVISVRRLKELRKKRHMSQLALATALDTTQNSISRYETGEREADYKTLIAFADFFNVSIDYLLERTDNPTINR